MKTRKKVKQLTNTTVTHVSLVQNPANEESFLMLKSKGEHTISLVVKQEDMAFTDLDEKQIVYGIVYSPDKLDADGEFMSAADIEKAAHEFLSTFRNIDGEHDFVSNLGVPVESYVVQKDTEIAGRIVKQGSWVLAIKATDEAWQKVKSGEFTGFSLAGKTTRREVNVNVDENGNIVKYGALKSVANSIIEALGFVKKDFNEEVYNSENNDVGYYLDLLYYALNEALYTNETPAAKKSEIMTSIYQFMAKINSMEFIVKQKEDKMEKETAKQEEQQDSKQDELQAAVENLIDKLGMLEKRMSVFDETEKRIQDLEKFSVESSKVIKASAGRIDELEDVAMKSEQTVEKAAPKKKEFNLLLGGYDE